MSEYIDDIIRGDDEELPLYFRMINEDGSHTPININGGTVFFTLKSDPELSDDDAELRIEMDTVDDDVNPTGYALLLIPKEKTDVLEPVDYYYDIQFKTATGKIKTYSPPKDASDDDRKLAVITDITRRTEPI